jgi:hypothetical protein
MDWSTREPIEMTVSHVFAPGASPFELVDNRRTALAWRQARDQLGGADQQPIGPVTFT